MNWSDQAVCNAADLADGQAEIEDLQPWEVNPRQLCKITWKQVVGLIKWLIRGVDEGKQNVEKQTQRIEET